MMSYDPYNPNNTIYQANRFELDRKYNQILFDFCSTNEILSAFKSRRTIRIRITLEIVWIVLIELDRTQGNSFTHPVDDFE